MKPAPLRNGDTWCPDCNAHRPRSEFFDVWKNGVRYASTRFRKHHNAKSRDAKRERVERKKLAAKEEKSLVTVRIYAGRATPLNYCPPWLPPAETDHLGYCRTCGTWTWGNGKCHDCGRRGKCRTDSA